MFEDLLETRKELIKSIIRNIEIFSKTNKEHKTYTLALYGKYGTGKTYFLDSLQKFIEGEHEDFNFKNNFKILKINAWQDDVLNNPILSIGLSILKFMEEENNKNKENKEILEKIKEDFKNNLNSINTIIKKSKKNIFHIIGNAIYIIYRIICSIISNLLSNKLLIDKQTQEKIKNIFSKKNFLKQLQQNNIDEEYKNYKKYIQNIQNALDQYIESLNNNNESSEQNNESSGKKQKTTKLLIIVDELDRFRPDYAVEFLEAINHIYDVENMVFLIAVDDNNLKSSMKVVYGLSMDFDSYIKKFFDYHFDLRNVNDNIDLKKYIENKIKEENIHILPELYCYNYGLTNLNEFRKNFFNNDLQLYNYDYTNNYRFNYVKYISYLFIDLFKLNLREINYAFRFIKYFFKENNNYKFFYCVSLLFLIAFKTKNNEKYKELFNCDINSKQNNNDVNINILGEILKDFEFYIDFYIYNNKTIVVNFKNYIGFCSFKYDYNNFNSDNLLNYENYKNIFDKDFFENNVEKWYKNNIIKSKEMFPSNAITIRKDDLAERNLKKSILRQCFEMLY